MSNINNPAAASGGITIGNAVSGGAANSVLFEDSSQNLATFSGFTFTSATKILATPDSITFGTTQVTLQSTTDGSNTNIRLVSPGVGSAFMGCPRFAGTVYSGTDQYIAMNGNGITFQGATSGGVGFPVHVLNVGTNQTTTGIKLLSIQNAGVEKFYTDKDGNVGSAALTITGNTDTNQLKIIANSTQTTNILQTTDSSANVLAIINSSGQFSRVTAGKAATEQFGALASAVGPGDTCVGNGAITTNASSGGCTAIGNGATTTGFNNVAIGGSASCTSNASVAIGVSASAAANGVAIGFGVSALSGTTCIGSASSVGNNGTAIGNGASTNNARSVAVGDSSFANFEGVAVGYAAATGNAGSANYSMCVGSRTATTGIYAIALGYSATAGANEFVVGSDGAPIQQMYFGGKVSTTPASIAINGSGGSGTNIAGSAITIAGGKGTGTATGGSVLIQTSPSTGSSGTTLQTLSTRVTIINTGLVGVGVTPSGNGTLQVITGTSSTIAKVGGTIVDHFADAGNSTTVETDLYSDSLAGSTLNTNGDKYFAAYAGAFVNSTSSKRLRVYFGGTNIFDSGALTVSAASDWDMRVVIIMDSSTSVRCTVSVNLTGASSGSFANYVTVTGLTLTNAQILKITGTASGVGAATNDIVASIGVIEWKSAA